MPANLESEPRRDPESYLLKINDQRVKVSGSYWETDGIYLNDVCLVVVVKPIGKSSSGKEKAGKARNKTPEGQEAKEELYGMLRGISSRALHHDLMRPLAAFVENPNAPAIVAGWGADQDWHRGAFTLYVNDSKEPGRPAPSPEELLDQRTRLLSSTQYQERSASDVLAKVTGGFKTPSHELATLCHSIEAVIADLAKEADSEKRQKSVEHCLDEWWNEIAKRSGAGEGR